MIAQLGKTKTQLSLSYEECRKDYRLLRKRWREVRFSYLKMRQQPKISWETFTLAGQELQFRLRNSPALLHSIAEYGKDVGKEIWDKTTRSLLLAGVLLSIAFGLYHLRRKAHALKDLPEEITLFERFGRRIFVDFTNSYPAFVPLITFGLTLAAFPEARESIGTFLFLTGGGLYGTWLINRSYKILLVGAHGKNSLLTISPAIGKSIYRRFALLTWLIYANILVHLFSSVLGYESDASRLISWILIILTFGILISLIRRRWISEFGRRRPTGVIPRLS